MNFIEQVMDGVLPYSDEADIDKLAQREGGLKNAPLQSIYTALKSLDPVDCHPYLKQLTKIQRQALLDIDLWNKDDLDIKSFHFWPTAYSEAELDLRVEFAKSTGLALFLKGKFNIQTFDLEDPQYPDHDNYFLTEDNLLLFEFEEDYEYVDEVHRFIKDLYTDLGVENAYAHLFKILSDTYSNMLEEEYKFKKGRLEELGHVDYYDALELTTPFPNKKIMDTTLSRDFINKSKIHLGLPLANNGYHLLKDELSKIKDGKQRDFLQLNFIRLVNSTLVVDDSLKKGNDAINTTVQKTRNCLLLGFDYVIQQTDRTQGSFFDCIEFSDLYRYGVSLVYFHQKQIKKAMSKSAFANDSSFLGLYWNDFLDKSLSLPVYFRDTDGRAHKVVSTKTWHRWGRLTEMFVAMIPFAGEFAVRFLDLKKSGRLSNDFYLNYSVDDIDFETIILNSLANFVLGNYKKGRSPNNKKMGLTIAEFKRFVSLFTTFDGTVNISGLNHKYITDFMKSFGMDAIPHFEEYIVYLLSEHFEGHEYSSFKDSDYHFVGGPVILNQTGQ